MSLVSGGAGGASAPVARESHAEIARSVRNMLAHFDDPTRMLELQKGLAVQEERYADAQVRAGGSERGM